MMISGVIIFLTNGLIFLLIWYQQIPAPRDSFVIYLFVVDAIELIILGIVSAAAADEEEKKAQRLAEEEQKQAQQQEESQRKQQEDSQRQLLKKYHTLAIKAHAESDFSVLEFREAYAKANLRNLISGGGLRKTILNEYQEVYADPEMLALIESKNPKIFGYLESCLDLIRIADRLQYLGETKQWQ